MAVSAQKDGDRKPPPKGNPPVVTPQQKNPPPDKPKRPGYAVLVATIRNNNDLG